MILAGDIGGTKTLVALYDPASDPQVRASLIGIYSRLSDKAATDKLVWIARNEYMAEYNLGEVMYQTGDLDRAAGYTRRVIEIESRHPEIGTVFYQAPGIGCKKP